MEYDPKPSFDSGSLVTASPETVAHARELLGPSLLAIRAEAERAQDGADEPTLKQSFR